MASRTRIFFRAVVRSYALVGYGIPYYCVLYHDSISMNKKYNVTRNAFKHSDRYIVIPFYYSRTSLEDTIRSKLESESGQFLFVYGKPKVGTSTIIRKICSQLQDGILRINAQSLLPFHQILADHLAFTFHDRYTWRNLWDNIHFPLALCIENKGDYRSQFQRTLGYLSAFCKSQRLWTVQRPWTLIIDDAEGMTREQFTDLYSSVIDLVDQDLLSVVVVSSDPVFAAFISNEARFNKIDRVQIDEMNEDEATEFLDSPPCKSFVDRMRKHRGMEAISSEELRECTQIAGGIPQWLVQCAVQSPNSWYEQRVKGLKEVVDQQENSQDFYRMQSYMISEGKSNFDLKDFVRAAGGAEDAVDLLQGPRISRRQRQNRMFFHDLDRDTVALQYEYLMKRPLSCSTSETTFDLSVSYLKFHG